MWKDLAIDIRHVPFFNWQLELGRGRSEHGGGDLLEPLHI